MLQHDFNSPDPLAFARGCRNAVLPSRIGWAVIALLAYGGWCTLADADRFYERDDARNQERFVAGPRSIASARNDVRL